MDFFKVKLIILIAMRVFIIIAIKIMIPTGFIIYLVKKYFVKEYLESDINFKIKMIV